VVRCWSECDYSILGWLVNHTYFLNNTRHLGSLTAANWVSFDFNVVYSSCWGYSLTNTLKLKNNKRNQLISLAKFGTRRFLFNMPLGHGKLFYVHCLLSHIQITWWLGVAIHLKSLHLFSELKLAPFGCFSNARAGVSINSSLQGISLNLFSGLWKRTNNSNEILTRQTCSHHSRRAAGSKGRGVAFYFSICLIYLYNVKESMI